jgi:hypothetical protein
MKMIHHHHVGPKLVQLGVTPKQCILNQGRDLSLTEPSRTRFSFVEDDVNLGEEFLVMLKFEFRNPFGRSASSIDLARKQPLRLFQMLNHLLW